jgi:tight adherence protein B
MLALVGALITLVTLLRGPRHERIALVERAARANMGDWKSRLTRMADKGLEKSGRTSRLSQSLDAAGINMQAGEFVLFGIVVIIGAILLGLVMIGPIGALIFAIVGLVGCRGYVGFKASRRRAAFDAQLSDTVGLLSSTMRSGQGLIQALDSISKQADAPTNQEFSRIVVETRLGKDLVQALYDLSDRMRSTDLRWTIPAIEINRTAGGDLGEVLDNVGRTIRDRADLRRQVKTLSAEGRFSAYVLVALPICVAGMMFALNPSYAEALTQGAGLAMSGLGVFSMTIGSVWLFKMCNIKF